MFIDVYLKTLLERQWILTDLRIALLNMLISICVKTLLSLSYVPY